MSNHLSSVLGSAASLAQVTRPTLPTVSLVCVSSTSYYPRLGSHAHRLLQWVPLQKASCLGICVAVTDNRNTAPLDFESKLVSSCRSPAETLMAVGELTGSSSR